MADFVLKSLEFRKERERTWFELEELLDKVEKKGPRALTTEELTRLPILYRAAVSSLSVARSISLDRNLVEYLEALAARAFVCVYGTRSGFWESVWAFASRQFPAMVRKYRWPICLSALFLLLGACTAFMMVLRDSEHYFTFVAEAYASGRDPTASTESLREVLYQGGEAGQLSAFASTLFSHNARIGMMSFALGFLAAVPTFLLLFINGLVLGAFAALYHSRGLSFELWAWLLPHGITEISALVLCGGAGIALGRAVIFPGRHTRTANLVRTGKEVAVIVIGAVFMLAIAGLIEGVFRQTVTNVTVRYAVASTTAVVWVTYFVFAGRERGPQRE